MMDRLQFVLPEFTRLSWVSDRAREVWEPRLKRIRQAWLEIEWLAVVQGVRHCCVTMASPEEFVTRAGEWAKRGLNALPIEIQGVAAASYANKSVPVEPGKPIVFRLVLGTPADVATFQEAWEAGDQAAIGRLLGYPACCYEFFKRVWVDEGLTDTTWPMALATAVPSPLPSPPGGEGKGEGQRSIQVSGPPQANILWRWLGVRAVSHLPCRFDCWATVKLADKLLAVGREAGFASEVDWLMDILSWPVEWSALHGIAEVKTPVLKISTQTDATARKYVVGRLGDAYPAEGATGIRFPYRLPQSAPLTGSRGFRRGLENPIQPWQQPTDGRLEKEAEAALVQVTFKGRAVDQGAISTP
jgi:hypothetical protein